MSKKSAPRRGAENEARAVARMLRCSARKLNLVAQSIRGLGAQPLFLLTPRLDWDVKDGQTVLNHERLHAFRRTQARVFKDVPFLSYYDPAVNPEFYRGELWYDSGHLNREGAEIGVLISFEKPTQQMRAWAATRS